MIYINFISYSLQEEKDCEAKMKDDCKKNKKIFCINVI